MKIVGLVLAILLGIFSGTANAAEPRAEGQVQLELIHKLETDGYLSKKLAEEAALKYVDVKQLQAPASTVHTSAVAPPASIWERYLTWLNFAKVMGLILLLVAFGGTVRNLIKGAWHVMAQVPVLAYQLPLLAISGYATLVPHAFWASQSVYVALLASFTNIILFGWLLKMHPKLSNALIRLFTFGIPLASVISFWAMLYFGVLALHYDSQILGFFAAVGFSGVLSFGLYYSTGTLYLHFNREGLFAVVFGHLAALALYIFLKVSGLYPASARVFESGLEYYCTIALCVGLVAGSSPWFHVERARPLMALLLIAVFASAMTGYFFWDLKVIGSIISCFFILFVLGWIAKLGYSAGLVAGSGLLGATLYGAAILMEKYGAFVVLSAS